MNPSVTSFLFSKSSGRQVLLRLSPLKTSGIVVSTFLPSYRLLSAATSAFIAYFPFKVGYQRAAKSLLENVCQNLLFFIPSIQAPRIDKEIKSDVLSVCCSTTGSKSGPWNRPGRHPHGPLLPNPIGEDDYDDPTLFRSDFFIPFWWQEYPIQSIAISRRRAYIQSLYCQRDSDSLCQLVWWGVTAKHLFIYWLDYFWVDRSRKPQQKRERKKNIHHPLPWFPAHFPHWPAVIWYPADGPFLIILR